MAKTPKRPRDPNQLAKLVVDIATGDKKPVVSAKRTREKKDSIAGSQSKKDF